MTDRNRMIKHLDNLINHRGTSASERAAAVRMRARLQATTAREWADTLSYGSKATREHLPTAVIARMIRADIALARKVTPGAVGDADIATMNPLGGLPRDVTISVRTPRPESIRITVTGAPDEWYEPHPNYIGSPRVRAGERLTAVGEFLTEIMDSYNWRDTDPTADYTRRRFYGHVVVDRAL